MSTANFSTFITKAGGTVQLYPGQNEWKQVTLRLETAGPVVYGNNQALEPVNSGKGILLPVNVEVKFFLPPLQKLYIASDTANRVAITISPIPYLADIMALLTQMSGGAAAPAPVGAGVAIGGFGFKHGGKGTGKTLGAPKKAGQ